MHFGCPQSRQSFSYILRRSDLPCIVLVRSCPTFRTSGACVSREALQQRASAVYRCCCCFSCCCCCCRRRCCRCHCCSHCCCHCRGRSGRGAMHSCRCRSTSGAQRCRWWRSDMMPLSWRCTSHRRGWQSCAQASAASAWTSSCCIYDSDRQSALPGGRICHPSLSSRSVISCCAAQL